MVRPRKGRSRSTATYNTPLGRDASLQITHQNLAIFPKHSLPPIYSCFEKCYHTEIKILSNSDIMGGGSSLLFQGSSIGNESINPNKHSYFSGHHVETLKTVIYKAELPLPIIVMLMFPRLKYQIGHICIHGIRRLMTIIND